MILDALLARFPVEARIAAAARRAFGALPDRSGVRALVSAKVLRAFADEGVSDADLAGTTGYGYGDPARARYESLLARVLGAERVLARLSIVSGTHAIVAALAACTDAGDTILAAAGRPYDTLHHALVTAPHALCARGRRYVEVPRAGMDVDLAALREACRAQRPAVVFVQRSRGYASRRSLSVDDCARIVVAVRESAPDAIVLVDNCYGELVEEHEPSAAGADLIAGSLIKNLGGGIAPAGGYVAGRSALIERVAAGLYAPGLGAGLGPSLDYGRLLMQGLFYAPLVVAEALRGLDFAAALFAGLGFAVDPAPGARRSDIVQAIGLDTPERLIAFARGLQRVLPVNGRFAPEPGAVPGYVDPVIMSGGAFVAGATIDLSCDAPLRAPFEVYLQGGTTFEHGILGALSAADAVAAYDREHGSQYG